jgi:hypothetical protein
MPRLALLAALVLASSPAFAQNADPVARLGWLSGCWEQGGGARITEEQWMVPRGATMLGMSRTVAGGVTRSTEQLRIEARDGKAVYVASPSGQATTAFTAASVSDTLVVFENPTHDFPTKISYRRIGKDSLLAQIAGPRGGREATIDFPMRRASCGTP